MDRFVSLNLANIEIIKAYIKPPWITSGIIRISEKSKMIKFAIYQITFILVAFTDSSRRNNLVKINVY